MKQFLFSAIAAALLLPALVWAQPNQQEAGWRGHARMQERMFDKLKLTDEQRDQIRTLGVANEKAQTELFAKIRNARIDMRELFHAATLDRSAIEKQMNVVSDLEHKAQMNRLDHLFAVYKVLTPEQQKLWREHMGRMWGMDGMRRGMPHRGGPGIGMLDDDAPAGPPEAPEQD